MFDLAGPGPTQESLQHRRQFTPVQALGHALFGTGARSQAPLLGTLLLGGATFGDLDPAPVLFVVGTELGLGLQEHAQVFVEIAHHPCRHRLHLGQQRQFGGRLTRVAVAGVGQHVQKAARRMAVAHEQARILQGDLGHRHHQLAQYRAQVRAQLGLAQQGLEQERHQVQGVGVGRILAHRPRVQAQARGLVEHFPAQAGAQVAAARDRLEARPGRGLQQGQGRHQLARGQLALAGHRNRVAGIHARLLQQLVQAGRQQFMLVTDMHIDRRRGGRGAAAALPLAEEARDPVRRVRRVVGAGRGRSGDRATALPALRQGRGIGYRQQLPFQRFVEQADPLHQPRLAQAHHRQLRRRGQPGSGQGRIDAHAQVLRTNGIAVHVQAEAPGDETQVAVQPHQFGTVVLLDRAGQVADRQPHFQLGIPDQGQVVAARQAAFDRQRPTGLQRLPGLGQVGTEAGDQRFAVALDLLDRLQVVLLQCRRGLVGPLEQAGTDAIEFGGERIGQWQQDHFPDPVEQVRVAAGQVVCEERCRHRP